MVRDGERRAMLLSRVPSPADRRAVQPLVSVIIPTYNHARYLAQTIESVLAQSWRPLEVIVVDDASTDETPDILAAFGDRIRSARLSSNCGGPARPRNTAIGLAKGEFISVFDSDDLMIPGNLARKVAFLLCHPDIPLVCADFENFRDDGRAERFSAAGHEEFQRMAKLALGPDQFRIRSPDAYDTLIGDNFVGTSGVVMRRSLVHAIGPFDERLCNADDKDFWFRVARRFDLGYIDAVLHRHRVHPGNISSRPAAVQARQQVYEGLERVPLSERARSLLNRRLAEVYFDRGYVERLGGHRREAAKYFLKSWSRRRGNLWPVAAALRAWLPNRFNRKPQSIAAAVAPPQTVSDSTVPAPAPTAPSQMFDEEIASFLARVGRPHSPETDGGQPHGADSLAEVYALLTHRRFCALSRERSRRYRDDALKTLGESYGRGEPLEFWLDIGPGYHASLRPGQLPVNYEIGLGEYLLLVQVRAFLDGVGRLYPPGARFRLVVDNLCALRTNDIPVERTAEYCARLRRLIEDVGMASDVRLFVESEEFGIEAYDAALQTVGEPAPVSNVSAADIDNVARFLGRPCSPVEAAERMRVYQRAGAATELLLSDAVRGVRLTQRATPVTLGFRSFAGGDARIQCGEVALFRKPSGGVSPILLTSRNVDLYDAERLCGAALLPSTIADIALVSHRG
jgi:glycosyltransferase involved in cell wall biosynthesis